MIYSITQGLIIFRVQVTKVGSLGAAEMSEQWFLLSGSWEDHTEGLCTNDVWDLRRHEFLVRGLQRAAGYKGQEPARQIGLSNPTWLHHLRAGSLGPVSHPQNQETRSTTQGW